jgi:cytochrome P450
MATARADPPRPEWDPFSHSTFEDPFPTYRALRDHFPVYRNAARDVWALTRFEDVQQAARDWRTYSNSAGVDLDDTTEVFGPGNFIDSDPVRHDELRALVKHQFTPKAIGALELKVRERVRALVAPIMEAGGGDIVPALAWPLPVATVCDVVGFPAEDAAQLQAWVAAAIHRLPGEGRSPASARRAVGEMHDYFVEIAADRRRRPRDDLLSAIATGEAGGSRLSEEIVGLCTLLSVAGTETTFSLIGNAVWLLGSHPEERRRLVDDPSGIPAALEEVLRFESPVQYLGRITTRDVELHGTTIPAGKRVALVFGAANRDDRRWPDPDTFDIARPPQRNLAFGEGIHHCLGAPLARLEGRMVLEELVRSMPEFSLDGPAERTKTYTTRGFESLPIQALSSP